MKADKKRGSYDIERSYIPTNSVTSQAQSSTRFRMACIDIKFLQVISYSCLNIYLILK